VDMVIRSETAALQRKEGMVSTMHVGSCTPFRTSSRLESFQLKHQEMVAFATHPNCLV
jgi:hypothetical protein